MINSDKRRAVAARMREIICQYPDCLLDGMIAQSILDVIGEGVPIGETVASLIDPTCYVVGTISYDWSDGTLYCHDLSCGHACETVYPEPPAFCDKCGARVVEKEARE